MAADLVPQLLNEQRETFDKIVAAALRRSNEQFWLVEGSGGTGKTFLYKAIYFYLTAKGLKVIASLHTLQSQSSFYSF